MQRDLHLPLPTVVVPAGMTFATWNGECAGQFFAVYDQAFRERPGFPGWNEATWRHAFTSHDEFRADLSLLLLAATKGVAYALCAVDEHASDTGRIVQMGVHPYWRNHGLGTLLLGKVLRRFGENGLQYAALEVNTNNPQALRLYERLGFWRTKRYTSYRKML
jgi:ribosomal protein S18 acetylase RimI-like enzyme